jgi:hypothetical protein
LSLALFIIECAKGLSSKAGTTDKMSIFIVDFNFAVAAIRFAGATGYLL